MSTTSTVTDWFYLQAGQEIFKYDHGCRYSEGSVLSLDLYKMNGWEKKISTQTEKYYYTITLQKKIELANKEHTDVQGVPFNAQPKEQMCLNNVKS
jgi:hypothetical protein